MKDFPLVSVVIAFLNEERFLGEAIDSVLGQDYTHWEILLVDDGSSDASSQIAKEYTAKYPTKIHYLEHAGHLNKGLSASRNLAIKNSRGKFIALLDADDVWRPPYLANQVLLMQQHKASMICEASEYWYSWEDAERKDVRIAVGTSVQDQLFQPQQLTLQLYPLGPGAAPCPCGLFIRKEALTRAGGFEEAFTGIYQVYEDQGLLSKLYLHEPVFVSSNCNNRYRQRSNSLVSASKQTNKYHQARYWYLKWFMNYLAVNGIQNNEVDKLLNKSLFPYRNPILYYVSSTLPKKAMTSLQKMYSLTFKKLFNSSRDNAACIL